MVSNFEHLLPPNIIINGGLHFWQRGTPFTSIASNAYHADRFRYFKAGAVVHDISRDTDLPDNARGAYSIKVEVTTADTSLTTNDHAGIGQRIEGSNFKKVWGTYGVLSFWVKSPKTGVHTVAFSNDTDRSYLAEYTIEVADTWQQVIIPVSFLDDDIPSGGTWDFTNGMGLNIMWSLGAGPDVQGAAGSWLSGAKIASTNQVNTMDSTSNVFKLADVMFIPGSTAAPWGYAGEDLQDELSKCNRYLYSINNPASSYTGGDTGLADSAAAATITVYFPSLLRVSPTVTVSSWSHWSLYDSFSTPALTGVATVTPDKASDISKIKCQFTSSGLTTGRSVRLQANNTSAALMYFDAEL